MSRAKHTMFPVSTPGESVRLLTENEVGSSPTLGAKYTERGQDGNAADC